MFNKRGGGEVGVTTVGADRDSPRLGRGTRHGPRAVRCAKVFFHKDVAFLINDYVKTNQRKKKREGGMALAARIASPQGVAFHTSTDAAPAERGARR